MRFCTSGYDLCYVPVGTGIDPLEVWIMIRYSSVTVTLPSATSLCSPLDVNDIPVERCDSAAEPSSDAVYRTCHTIVDRAIGFIQPHGEYGIQQLKVALKKLIADLQKNPVRSQ